VTALGAFVALYALVMGCVCLGVWQSKGGHPAVGFVLGFLLGIIGLLYVGFARPAGDGVAGLPQDGDIVRTVRRVRMGGRSVPPGLTGRVLTFDLVDQDLMAKLETGGEQLWVPAGSVRVVRRGSPRSEKVCPDCAETVKSEARVCRFCGHQFDAERTTEGGP
jgi:hypothetical protein